MSHRGKAQFLGISVATTSRAYVVYDRSTGDIINVHHVVELLGHGSDAESHKARALRMAGGRARANAGILEVDSSEVNRIGPIGVDPERRVIIARPAESRSSSLPG